MFGGVFVRPRILLGGGVSGELGMVSKLMCGGMLSYLIAVIHSSLQLVLRSFVR